MILTRITNRFIKIQSWNRRLCASWTTINKCKSEWCIQDSEPKKGAKMFLTIHTNCTEKTTQWKYLQIAKIIKTDHRLQPVTDLEKTVFKTIHTAC